jgi:hypothetical protein
MVFNNLVEDESETFYVGDFTAPTLDAMVPEEHNNTEREFTVDLFFSEAVVGVMDAVTVDGGTLAGVEVDDTDPLVYHVMIEGADLAEITLTVDVTEITDASVNANVCVLGTDVDGIGDYVVGDWVAPEIESVVADVDDEGATPNEFTVYITFSEEVVGTDLGITVDGFAVASTNVGNVYTVELSGEDGDVITLGVSDVITDVSINANALANPDTWVYTVGDNTPPTVSVLSPSATDTVQLFDVLVEFSEPVSVVDETTVTVSGHAPEIVELDPVVEGLVYQITIWAPEGDTVTLAFSDAIVDAVGLPLAGQTIRIYYHGRNSSYSCCDSGIGC